MRVHFILHEAFEPAGALETWAEERGHTVTCTRIYRFECAPPACDIDLLVVMGGPQSPHTSRQTCPHFDARSEIALIRDVHVAGGRLLGVCLGAQLMGVAFGAPHAKSEAPEFGAFEVHLTAEGSVDPVLASLPTSFVAAHWHQDMPGTGAHGTVLATSAGCSRQIVRYDARAYAFQCHLELDRESLAHLFDVCADDLLALRDERFVGSRGHVGLWDVQAAHSWLYRFLDSWTTTEHRN